MGFIYEPLIVCNLLKVCRYATVVSAIVFIIQLISLLILTGASISKSGSVLYLTESVSDGIPIRRHLTSPGHIKCFMERAEDHVLHVPRSGDNPVNPCAHIEHLASNKQLYGHTLHSTGIFTCFCGILSNTFCKAIAINPFKEAHLLSASPRQPPGPRGRSS